MYAGASRKKRQLRLACGILFCASVASGDDGTPPRYQAVFFLHVLLSVAFACYGTRLWWSRDSLPGLAHYLEDPRRSNDLLVYVFCWAPLLVLAFPMLVLGTAQDILDTSIQVVGGLMYIPLLDEPLALMLLYSFYSCLCLIRLCSMATFTESQARIWSISSLMLRTWLIEVVLFGLLRMRICYLSRARAPLTSSSLTKFEAAEGSAVTKNQVQARRQKVRPEHLICDP